MPIPTVNAYLDIYTFDTFHKYPFLASVAFPFLYICALVLCRILTLDRPESNRGRERTGRNRRNTLTSHMKAVRARVEKRTVGVLQVVTGRIANLVF